MVGHYSNYNSNCSSTCLPARLAVDTSPSAISFPHGSGPGGVFCAIQFFRACLPLHSKYERRTRISATATRPILRGNTASQETTYNVVVLCHRPTLPRTKPILPATACSTGTPAPGRLRQFAAVATRSVGDRNASAAAAGGLVFLFLTARVSPLPCLWTARHDEFLRLDFVRA